MSRGGARRKDKWRRDLRAVSKYLRHDAAPFKDCPHTNVGWTLSVTGLPAIVCWDCQLMATGGSIVLARQQAAAGDTPKTPPAKNPKGISLSEASGPAYSPPKGLEEMLSSLHTAKAAKKTPTEILIDPETQDLLKTEMAKLTIVQGVPPEPGQQPITTLFGIPVVVAMGTTPSGYQIEVILEAYKQKLISKHQAESLIGLPIVDEAPGQGEVGKLSEHWAIPADKLAELLEPPDLSD